MFNAYECQVCHTVKEGADALCQPRARRTICSPQVSGELARSEQCDLIAADTDYYCATCGRPSPEPEGLCAPQPY
jgi:hypothetical protein